jgi:hypothetical protein
MTNEQEHVEQGQASWIRGVENMNNTMELQCFLIVSLRRLFKSQQC